MPEKKNHSLNYLDMKKLSDSELISEIFNQMLLGNYDHSVFWCQFMRGYAHQQGSRAPIQKLLEQCRQYINQGNVNALVVHGLVYFYRIAENSDNKKAIESFELAIKLGSPQAMSNRAYMHRSGQGGEKNYPEAIRLYEQAMALGNTSAMTNRAYMYAHGMGGDHNYPEAFRLYEQAITLGDASAMTNRAYMYVHGEGGEQDYPMAFRLYEQACALGDTGAMIDLAAMHKRGQGGEINHPEAIRLYEQAYRCGYYSCAYLIKNAYTALESKGVCRVIDTLWNDLLAGDTFSDITMKQLQLKGKDILLEKLTDLNSVTGTSLYRLKQVAESSHPIARILNYSSADKAEHTKEYEKLLEHIELINGQRRALYSIKYDENSTIYNFFSDSKGGKLCSKNAEIIEHILNLTQPGNATDIHITMNKYPPV